MTDDASRDELQLVARVRAGDERAFLQLVEQYHPMLRRLAGVYLGSSVAAEELVEDTWVTILARFDRLDRRSTPRVWVCRALRELARTRCRERDLACDGAEDVGEHRPEPALDRRRFRSDGHWEVPPRSFGDVPLQDFAAWAKAAADALPRAEREVLTLRDLEGWTAGEVCALLAINEAQQRALLRHGRSRVCAALEALVAERSVAGVAA
jgi:RNA polymerase sigma-70 factor (ECF subfamily)